jgi:hypothetical protein
MKKTGELFTVRHNDKQVAIEAYKAAGNLVYHVKFTDQPPIFITRTVNAKSNDSIWTSVPEGNLKLAIEVGKLIDERMNLPKQKNIF